MVAMKVTIDLYIDVEEASTEEEAEHILRQFDDAELWEFAHHVQYEYSQA